MELLFLGTGAGVPAKARNVTSLALIMPEKNGTTWLFDCGEATQHQILHTKVRLSKVSVIFITHLHGDHLYGLPGVLGSRSFQGGSEPLTVVGPPGLKPFIEVTLSVSKTHLRYPIEVVEIEKPGICYEDEDIVVETKPLDHGVPCFGFRLMERDKPGTLLVEKLKREGIEPGPIYRKIKEESEVKLKDGRVLRRADYLGPMKKGRIITILGDTRPCQNGVELSKHAEVLVHDATFGDDQEELAHDYFHSSAKQAAEIAKAANAAALILTHISSRFATWEESLPLLEQAKAVFPGTYLAKDFWSYEVPYQPR